MDLQIISILNCNNARRSDFARLVTLALDEWKQWKFQEAILNHCARLLPFRYPWCTVKQARKSLSISSTSQLNFPRLFLCPTEERKPFCPGSTFARELQMFHAFPAEKTLWYFNTSAEAIVSSLHRLHV